MTKFVREGNFWFASGGPRIGISLPAAGRRNISDARRSYEYHPKFMRMHSCESEGFIGGVYANLFGCKQVRRHFACQI